MWLRTRSIGGVYGTQEQTTQPHENRDLCRGPERMLGTEQVSHQGLKPLNSDPVGQVVGSVQSSAGTTSIRHETDATRSQSAVRFATDLNNTYI